MIIQGSFWVGGIGLVNTLILLRVIYATDQHHFVAFIGLIVGCGVMAGLLWMIRLKKKAKHAGEMSSLKSEFISQVSHELRTPLTTIKVLTRLLLAGVTVEKQREYLETMSVECDRQIELVLNLLDLSRIESREYRLNLERVEVADTVMSCVNAELAAAKRRQHTLQFDPFDKIPPIAANAKSLSRVVNNLIENSIKYTPDGGLINLSIGSGANYVEIRVTDNGRGIPNEDLSILFDKFYRGCPAPHSATSNDEFLDDADVSGLGLGLYLARDLMNRMGGQISVETEIGTGSTFKLRFPVWNENGSREPLGSENGNGKKIIGRRR
jgi:signal transduction histidine kinase